METEQLQRSTEFEPVSQNFEAKTWGQDKELDFRANFDIPTHKHYAKSLTWEQIASVLGQISPPSTTIRLMTGRGGMELFQETLKKEIEKFGKSEE